MKKTIGIILLTIFFAGIFYLFAMQTSFIEALIAFVIAIAVTAIIVFAVWLIVE